jgi:crotonobetainyl-CoA:carnitine CoA-transferase CaiB-like acyl-CoA transferase
VSPADRIRVVELAGGVAGAVCSHLFASLGHDVVRYEPPGGDPLARQEPLNDDGMGLAFVALNSGKRRQALRPGWAPKEDAALDRADVVVVDTSSGARSEDAAAVTPDRLQAGRPELVVVRISGLGSDAGEGLPTDSLLAESEGGLATMIGDPSARPLSLGGEQTAYCTGIAGFLGAMIALRRRDGGAGGEVVDVCMSDIAAYMDWKGDVGVAQTGAAPRRSGPQPGDWRLVPALDGWVGCIFQQEHWSGVVTMVGAKELTDPMLADPAVRATRGKEWWPVIERWASTLPAEEIYRRAQAFGLPFGWVCRSSDLVEAEQFCARGFLADLASFDGRGPAVRGPVRAAGLSWSSGTVGELEQDQAPEPLSTRDPSGQVFSGSSASSISPAPLAGVVVLDFGTITAGAAVTRLLSDYGATVVKVESPDRPDRFRRWKLPPEALADADGNAPTSPYFASNNVGKLSLALDLKSNEGQRVIHTLAERSHVLVENYRVGVTARLGIDAPTVQGINPELVYLSLSSQGQTGPDALHTSYGSTLDLLSGLASVTGYGPDEPRWSSSDVNYPDQLVAFFGAALVAYCLQFAPGTCLDVSQREVVSWTLAAEIADSMLHGVTSSPQGNHRPRRTPHDTFPCREDDTWVAISCGSDAQRRSLATLIGAALADGDETSWLANREPIDERLGRWTRGLSRDDATAALRAAGVPAAPVLDAADRLSTPGFFERGIIASTTSGPLKGKPLRLRGFDGPQSLVAPRLGEHTREILRDLAGQSDAEIDRLESLGVVTCTP